MIEMLSQLDGVTALKIILCASSTDTVNFLFFMVPRSSLFIKNIFNVSLGCYELQLHNEKIHNIFLFTLSISDLVKNISFFNLLTPIILIINNIITLIMAETYFNSQQKLICVIITNRKRISNGKLVKINNNKK